MSTIVISSFFFFFNDTATTEIYTLSLHDALPIWEIVFGFTSADNAGNGGIASLADFDSLRVEADVFESQVAKLAIGTPAEIVLDAFPDRRDRGKVAEGRPRGDRAEATVRGEVAVGDQPKAG